VKQHQCEQTGCLRRRSRRHQRPYQARQTDGLGAKIGPHQRPASRGGITFIEDEIDDGENGVEASRHFAGDRHAIGNTGIADLSLRPHQSLGHGRGRHKKGAGDLVCFKASESAQRQGDLSLRSNGRVAAGENQAKAVVGNLIHLGVGLFAGPYRPGGNLGLHLLVKANPAADAINRLVPRRLYDPRSRRVGDSLRRPLFDGGCKCFLSRFLRNVEISKVPDQRGDDPAPVRPVNGIDRSAEVRRSPWQMWVRHLYTHLCKSLTPLKMGPPVSGQVSSRSDADCKACFILK
jgi:hypothetical protein